MKYQFGCAAAALLLTVAEFLVFEYDARRMCCSIRPRPPVRSRRAGSLPRHCGVEYARSDHQRGAFRQEWRCAKCVRLDLSIKQCR